MSGGLGDGHWAGRPILPTCQPRSSDGVCAELQQHFRQTLVVSLDNARALRGCASAHPGPRTAPCRVRHAARRTRGTPRRPARLVIPPMPTIGRRVAAWHAWTAASATGLSDGPERPPVPRASAGSSVRGSSASPRSVLMSERPSAPASATARATSRDVGMRRRELRVEPERRRRAARGDDLGGGVGRLVDVRAGEVELDRLDVRRARRTSRRSRQRRSRRRRSRAAARARAAAAACRRGSAPARDWRARSRSASRRPSRRCAAARCLRAAAA